MSLPGPVGSTLGCAEGGLLGTLEGGVLAAEALVVGLGGGAGFGRATGGGMLTDADAESTNGADGEPAAALALPDVAETAEPALEPGETAESTAQEAERPYQPIKAAANTTTRTRITPEGATAQRLTRSAKLPEEGPSMTTAAPLSPPVAFAYPLSTATTAAVLLTVVGASDLPSAAAAIAASSLRTRAAELGRCSRSLKSRPITATNAAGS